MDAFPIVSIICTTYNHEDYIKKALDGFVCQITDFPFEIIVHDDASTDNTISILKEYEERYPHLFRNIYRTENWFSQGKDIWSYLFVNAARGKYIAICEGDDYWIDANKLQRQVDFLEHSEHVAIAENSKVLNSISKIETLFSDKEERDLVLEEILLERQFATASVMLQKSVADGFARLDKSRSFDTLLWTYCLTQGKFRYLSTVSSVYLRGMQGIVLSTNRLMWAHINEKWTSALKDLLFPTYICNEKIFSKRNFNQYRSCFYFYIRRMKLRNAWISFCNLIRFL